MVAASSGEGGGGAGSNGAGGAARGATAEPELHYMEVTEQQAYQEVLMEAMENTYGAEVSGASTNIVR